MNKIDKTAIEMFKITCNPQLGEPRSSLDFYQEIATRSAVYPGQGTALGLMYCSLKLNGEAGELAEHVGKAMRDDDLILQKQGHDDHWKGRVHVDLSKSELTPERKALIIKEVGDNLWYLSAICNELGIKLSDAAIGNLTKLSDRQDRGVLRGSGDER